MYICMYVYICIYIYLHIHIYVCMYICTLPGSCRMPVEPGTLCDSELPCVALPPLKFHFFITPWKPFPLLMPQTSTNWPGTKCKALIFVPSGSSASGVTVNSATFLLGVAPDSVYCPAVVMFTRLAFASPTPNCRAVYPSVSIVFLWSTWHSSR